jgi:hemerythrin
MTIAWNSSYAIGYPVIDAQHQELFNRFNAFVGACLQKQGRKEVVRLFEFLDEYVVLHFNAEESLMAAYDYPESSMHRDEHQDFIGKLQGWHRHLQQEGSTLDLVVDTNEALIHWLIRHIRTVDVALGTFLRSRQV